MSPRRPPSTLLRKRSTRTFLLIDLPLTIVKLKSLLSKDSSARILRVLRRSHPSLISNARVTDKVKSSKYGEVLNINVKSYSCSQNQILRSNNFHLEIELGCSYLNFKEQISKRTCTEFVFVSFIETVISKLGHSKKYHLL